MKSKECVRSFHIPLFLIVIFGMSVQLQAATHTVQVLDPRSFSPNDLTIEVGDTVRWVNAAGGNLHDVTADDFSFASVTASSFDFSTTSGRKKDSYVPPITDK